MASDTKNSNNSKKTKKTGIEHLEQNYINWFPGHMNKAVKEIKKNIKLVNIVIEVRDARAPLASGNKESYCQNSDKPFLIVLNKTNLADPAVIEQWKKWFAQQGEPFIFINALDKGSIKKVVDQARKVLYEHRLKSNPDAQLKSKIKMMILGLPNTGKSTIINKLANRSATKAAATPGQTRNQIWVKVNSDVDLLDTPGVMPPKIKEQIHAMWLSAVHAIPDHIVTPEDSACFIIRHFIKNHVEIFAEHYKFTTPPTDLIEALDFIGKKRGCLQKGGEINYDQVYNIVINDFRRGILGATSFEAPPIK